MKTFFTQRSVRIGLTSIVLAILLAYFFLIPRNPGPFRAVPSQTSVLIAFNGLVKAGQQVRQMQDSTWRAVLKTSLFQNTWNEIGAVEKLFHHDAPIRAAFAKNCLVAAYSLHPADSLHALFALDIDDDFDLQKVLATNSLNCRFFPYQFHSRTLYTVHLSKQERVVVARSGRLLVFSRYSYLVEDALTQLESTGGWWADDKYLGDLDPEAALRVFFRPSKWAAQYEGRLLPAARIIPKTVADNVSWLGLAWNGKTAMALGEASGFLSGIGKWNGAKRGDVFSVAPDNTAFLAWAGFDNRKLFFEKLAEHPSSDFDHFVLPWIGSEAALVVTEPLSAALTDDRLLVLAVSDSARARQLLEEYGKSRGLLTHEQIGMFDVFGFQSPALLTPFFSAGDIAFQNPYFVHLGNYMVVAPNRPSIEVFIDKIIGNQTLAQNTDFLQMAGKYTPKGRGLLVLNGGYLTRILQQLFAENTPVQDWHADVETVSGIGWMSAELSPGMGRELKLACWSQSQTLSLPQSNIFWKTNLAAPAVTGAFSIDQPGMPLGAAILIQDKQTRLYCLRPDGAIAWQKNLGNYVISPIKGIDYFQNGRNCYLFNTKTQVWLLDENGKDVQGYPLNLKAPACTGIAIVDFDKNLKYNDFVCCDNGNVYGFDPFGRALEGWNPQAETGVAAGPVLHFQFSGKDYLAVVSTEGLLSVFGRDGKPRFPAIALHGHFNNPSMLDKTGAKPRILCVSNEGTLFDCDLDGKCHERGWPGRIANTPLKIAAVDWKGAPAFAILQGKQLNIVKWTGNNFQTLYTSPFNEPQTDIFPLDGGLGACARLKSKIALFDTGTGQMAPGFPLAGSTPFSLCRIGQQPLAVTGNGSAVFAYKLGDEH